MENILTSIKSNFPFSEFREYQLETIAKIITEFNSGKKFVIVEAPTGSGKSPIALTLSNMYQNSYILTPQKILQDQYMKDFPDSLIDLKGRGEYYCQKSESLCNLGMCKLQGKTSLPECGWEEGAEINSISCQYYKRLREAQLAKTSVLNFQSFFYQSKLKRFYQRELLIIDECHNTESQIINMLGVSISENQLKSLAMRLPQFNKVSSCIDYLREEGIVNKLKSKIKELKFDNKFAQAEKATFLLNSYYYLDKVATDSTFILDHQSNFNIISKETAKSILFRPLYVKKLSSILFDYGDKVLLMSGTILNYKLFCENLGIELNDSTFIKVPSTFLRKNRPIVEKNVGYMTWKHVNKTMPKMIREINNILSKHSNFKGIIHTHSFKILNEIKKGIDIKHKDRLLFQNDFKTRESMLAHHTTTKNSVIVAPAMHEGLDLKDDLSRFQIICKVPYPSSVADNWMSRRTKDSWHFYIWLTALKLVQSYGRSVRSKEDKAITYILDSNFANFKMKNGYILPDWFLDAFVTLK